MKFLAIAALIASGCSASCEPAPDGGPPAIPEARDASYAIVEAGTAPSKAPCDRSDVLWIGKRRVDVLLPCRPYDRLKDDPDPPF